jgi:protein involved in polysaccharide export with SLBB domain
MLCCLLGGSTVFGASDYAVRADDKLKVKIFQYPELSGEYTVSTTGTISIAPIGEISVAGNSVKEIASQISDRFIKAGLSDKPGTTVEILQSRPIYVMGDVQKPGEYTYRPGMTVLQAISLAGGWFRLNDAGLTRIDREAITLRGDMRNLVSRYYHLVAQRARLDAELALRNEVTFPSELTGQAIQDPALGQLIREERSFLSINVDALKNQLDTLEKTRTLYEREIEAISLQIQANRTQHESVQRELREVNALFARGLAPISRRTGLEREQAQIAMAEQGFQTLILRARQNITQLDQRIFELKFARQVKLSEDLQRTRLDLQEVLNKLDTNQNLMVEAQITAPSLVSTADEIVEARSITVIRAEEGKSATLEAEDTTELLPGDVLKVQRSVVPSGLSLEKSGLRSKLRGLLTPVGNKN